MVNRAGKDLRDEKYQPPVRRKMIPKRGVKSGN